MSWLWTPNILLTTLLVVMAVYCSIRERQTPAYWAWRRDLAAWKGQRCAERQRSRAAHRDLLKRHHALARRIFQTSRRQYCSYLWHARQHEHNPPALNRYVTTAERAWNVAPHATAPLARLPSPNPPARPLPGLPGARPPQ